jgi:hypothetical protein
MNLKSQTRTKSQKKFQASYKCVEDSPSGKKGDTRKVVFTVWDNKLINSIKPFGWIVEKVEVIRC